MAYALTYQTWWHLEPLLILRWTAYYTPLQERFALGHLVKAWDAIAPKSRLGV